MATRLLASVRALVMSTAVSLHRRSQGMSRTHRRALPMAAAAAWIAVTITGFAANVPVVGINAAAAWSSPTTAPLLSESEVPVGGTASGSGAGAGGHGGRSSESRPPTSGSTAHPHGSGFLAPSPLPVPRCAIQFLVLIAAFKNDNWMQCTIYNDTSVILVAGLRDLGFTAVGRCCLVDDAGPAGHGDCLNGPRQDAEFDSSQVILLNAQSANAAWDMQNFFDTAAVPARDAPWPPDIVANGWLPATASTLLPVKRLSVALSPW